MPNIPSYYDVFDVFLYIVYLNCDFLLSLYRSSPTYATRSVPWLKDLGSWFEGLLQVIAEGFVVLVFVISSHMLEGGYRSGDLPLNPRNSFNYFALSQDLEYRRCIMLLSGRDIVSVTPLISYDFFHHGSRDDRVLLSIPGQTNFPVHLLR